MRAVTFFLNLYRFLLSIRLNPYDGERNIQTRHRNFLLHSQLDLNLAGIENSWRYLLQIFRMVMLSI